MAIADSPWVATYTRWQDRARCKQETPGFDFVPDIETGVGRDLAAGWCSFCPVRTECLRYALLNGAEGYWAGTDTAQRRKLRAKKDRAKCPVCSGTGKIVAGMHELCLSCGMSWPRGKPPVKKELPPVPTDGSGTVIVQERYL